MAIITASSLQYADDPVSPGDLSNASARSHGGDTEKDSTSKFSLAGETALRPYEFGIRPPLFLRVSVVDLLCCAIR